MPRRGENIYKRKDGRWEGRMSTPNGKCLYFYAKTYREAKEKKKALWERIRLDETMPSKPTIDSASLFESWLAGKKNQVKPSTFGNYSVSIQKYVIPFFRQTGNEQITEISVSRFVHSIIDGCSLAESTKKKILVIFKTALREILKGSVNQFRILEAIKLPKTDNSQIQVFSINEQRVIEDAVLHARDMSAYGIILCFYTGIRIGELCALKWGDIDFEAGTMFISRTVSRVKNYKQGETKTVLLVGSPKSSKSVRKIPLPEFMLKHWAGLKSLGMNENFYVLSRTDQPTDPRTYQKLYRKVLTDAGVKYRKFHAIRHTFATRAMELGVDIKTLSEILGHSNVSITLNIYAHSLIKQKKIAIDKLNSMHLMYMGSTSIAVI